MMLPRLMSIPWLEFLSQLIVAFAMFGASNLAFADVGRLEVHYINVGQGGANLIVGPNGTRILYDFGAVNGDRDIVPYLRDKVGLGPSDNIHYSIVSHRDKDHYMGYRAVIETGYDITVANYDSGSTKRPSRSMIRNWLKPAELTLAGAVRSIPVGLSINLGDGAEVIVVAANGRIIGERVPIAVPNENDRSVVLLIRYGHFHFLLDGDLGSGPEDCTRHETRQRDIQTRVALALIREGLITVEHGVDVLHIAHHGSESSTSAAYYNYMRPQVGIISVGLKNKRYMHPREDVVDTVLLGGQRPECVKAPPLEYLYQTEDGEIGCVRTGCSSNNGLSIGNIKLTTDGKAQYDIAGDNVVHGGSADADLS